MGFVSRDVVVRQIDAESWELEHPVVYRGRDEEFNVPEGFRTDFASVPRLVVWLIPRYGIYTRSAILHDYLCTEKPVDRADADGLFRRSMRELGVSAPRRWMMWAAVRAYSLMSRADAKQWLAFLVVAPFSLAFVVVPAVVVQVFLILFWIVELAFWLAHRVFGTARPPAPRLQVRAD